MNTASSTKMQQMATATMALLLIRASKWPTSASTKACCPVLDSSVQSNCCLCSQLIAVWDTEIYVYFSVLPFYFFFVWCPVLFVHSWDHPWGLTKERTRCPITCHNCPTPCPLLGIDICPHIAAGGPKQIAYHKFQGLPISRSTVREIPRLLPVSNHPAPNTTHSDSLWTAQNLSCLSVRIVQKQSALCVCVCVCVCA